MTRLFPHIPPPVQVLGAVKSVLRLRPLIPPTHRFSDYADKRPVCVLSAFIV
jgi:hypothetical protein